ncbi:destrin [Leptodactylus fuscus]|uniref:destrin n=1 Tax=Leptodactylus fuscus TaxID=238119 RepID=UPI003F4E7843
MASGVRVDESVPKLFMDMKLKKSGKKAAFFCFSEDEKSIIVDKEKEILTNDCANFFARLKALLPEKKCCYALLDIHYITGESKKEDLIFVMWAPESATIKAKLMHASSKPCLTRTFNGVSKYWECHGLDEFTMENLADKLSNCEIKSIEGQPL